MKKELVILLAVLSFMALSNFEKAAGSARDTALQLVEPQAPISFMMIRDGGESRGVFETEEGGVKAIRLEEGDVTWQTTLIWADGELVAIEKSGRNPSLGRSTYQEIKFERNDDGRIQSQHVYSRGKKLYEIRYNYGSSGVPQSATVFSGANQPIERLRYEYGRKSWSHPVYLFSGLHFGQVRTYSDHGSDDGKMTLFAVGSYSEDDWKIKTLTMSVSEPSRTEIQRFNYDSIE